MPPLIVPSPSTSPIKNSASSIKRSTSIRRSTSILKHSSSFVAERRISINPHRSSILNLLKNNNNSNQNENKDKNQSELSKEEAEAKKRKFIVGESTINPGTYVPMKRQTVFQRDAIAIQKKQSKLDKKDAEVEREKIKESQSFQIEETVHQRMKREAKDISDQKEESSRVMRDMRQRNVDRLNKELERPTCCRTMYTCCGIIPCLFTCVKGTCLTLTASCLFCYSWTLWEVCGKVTHRVNKEEYLLQKYSDQRGELVAAFRALSLDYHEKMRWVELWSRIDSNNNNTMEVVEFLKYFDFKRTVYTKRMFAIFNRDFNGFVNIRDFLVTCWVYLPFDANRVAELSFRLLSRRGDTFDPDVTVLDLVDITAFVEDRYDPLKKKSATLIKKIAVNIFSFINNDGGGGIGFDEFKTFSRKNQVFLYIGYYLQQQIRFEVFGEQYWREATNDRPEMYTRDGPLEGILRHNIDAQLPSLGYLRTKNDKASGNKFKDDFPDAWFAAKEKVFLAKRKAKENEALSNEMAKQTYTRMVKVFVKFIPDALGLRPAFALWKDWAEYDKSQELDGGESYRLTHMSLLDVKAAVQATSLGRTTEKLEATRALKEEESDNAHKATIHEEVLAEVAKSRPLDDDIVTDIIRNFKVYNNDSYIDRMNTSIPADSKYNPEKLKLKSMQRERDEEEEEKKKRERLLVLGGWHGDEYGEEDSSEGMSLSQLQIAYGGYSNYYDDEKKHDNGDVDEYDI